MFWLIDSKGYIPYRARSRRATKAQVMLGNMRIAYTAVLLLFGVDSALVQAQEAHYDICIDICVSTTTVGFVSQP